MLLVAASEFYLYTCQVLHDVQLISVLRETAFPVVILPYIIDHSSAERSIAGYHVLTTFYDPT